MKSLILLFRSSALFRGGIIFLWAFLLFACGHSTPNDITNERVSTEPVVHKLKVDGREVDVWSWGESNSRGVILFSHGAQSAPWKYEPLVQHWLENGFRVYAALHVDSTDHPRTEDFAGFASWAARLEDMEVLADTYGGDRYIAAGHSYGALLALVKGGVSATPGGFQGQMTDPRVSMVLAFSPPPAIPGLVAMEAFADLSVPALIQTGTQDIPAGISTRGWQAHLDAFEHSKQGGDRFALIIDDVDHYFGGAICRPELPGPAQNDQIAIALDFANRMIDAYHLGVRGSKQELMTRVSDLSPVVFLSK